VSTGDDEEKVPFTWRRSRLAPNILRRPSTNVPGLYEPGTKPPPEKNPFGPTPPERTEAQTTKSPPPKAKDTKKAAEPKQQRRPRSRLTPNPPTPAPAKTPTAPPAPPPPAPRPPVLPPSQPTVTTPVPPLPRPTEPSVSRPSTEVLEGVPPEYSSHEEWLRSGLSRQPVATLVALLASYSGVLLALWAAALGLVLGIILAVGLAATTEFTRALFHAGAGTSVTIVTVVTGALAGAGGSFFAVYGNELLSSPSRVLTALGGGAMLALAVVIIIAVSERTLLRLRGYRRLSKDEVRRIAPLVQQAGDALRLRKNPRFAMSDLLLPNAWTHMRTIVFTKGLLDTLDDNELRAVIAHELHHWRSGDAVGERFVWACAFPIAVLYNLGVRLSGQPLDVEVAGRRVFGRGFIAFVGWMFLWPSWVLTKLVIVPITAKRQREHEYEADAAAKAAGYGESLASALRTMSAFEGGRTGWEQALAATHPPTELRLEALQPRQPDDWEYEQEELGIVPKGLIQVAGIGALVLIIGIGAGINSNRTSSSASSTSSPVTPPTTQPQQTVTNNVTHGPPQSRAGASAAAAAFAAGLYQDVLSSDALNKLVAANAVDNGATTRITTDANQAFSGLQNAVAQGVQATVHADAIGCRVDSYDARNATASIGVRIHLASTVFNGTGNSTEDGWFTAAVELRRSGGQWKVTNLTYDQASASSDPTQPAGFGRC
jgi:Zn-dependent protease with chaperone function